MRSPEHTVAIVVRFTDKQVAVLDRHVASVRRTFPGLNFTRCDLVRQLTMTGLKRGQKGRMP